MKFIRSALMLSLVTGLAFAQPEKTERPARVFAQFAGDTLPGGAQKLYVYSKEPLTLVEYRVGDAVNWEKMAVGIPQDGTLVFGTPAYQQEPKAGQTFHIRAIGKDSVRFTDLLIVGADRTLTAKAEAEEKGEVTFSPSTPAPAVPAALAAAGVVDYNTMLKGSSSVDAQSIAQARANEMARLNTKATKGVLEHLGTGFVDTASGNLAEGVGWGKGITPSTCLAKNGTAAIADASATANDGSVYRVRLYNSPTGTYDPDAGKVQGTTTGRSRRR